MSRLVTPLAVVFILIALIAPRASATAHGKNTNHSHRSSTHSRSYRNSKGAFLVPPPPPYVPTLLPELTYSRYYGHSPYGSSNTSASPKLFKPNKYLTYCL